MVPCLLACGALLADMATTAVAQGAATGWQASANTLAAEKARAETCVSILKRHAGDDAATLSRGQLAYAGAKAEADAAIAGLTMALAEAADESVSLEAVETHLAEASAQREAFCVFAVAQIPSADGNSRQVATDVLAKGVEGLISAAKDLFLNYRKETLLRRETIGNQIEAKRWREFEEIPG
jgi:hypothetical protein